MQIQRSYLKDFFFLFLLLLISLYYTSLLSYSPLDPAFNSAHFPEVVPQNLVGSWGASVSAYFIFTFGLSAYLIPLPFLFIGLHSMKNPLSIVKTFLYFLSVSFFYLFSSFMYSYFKPSINISGIEISTLGDIGLFLKNQFYSKIGDAGSFIVSIFFGLLSILMLIRYDFIFDAQNKLLTSFKRR